MSSNEIDEPITALETYRNRDTNEKALGNINERLNCRRVLVFSNAALESKLRVAFISLMLLPYINKMMKRRLIYSAGPSS